MNYLIEKRELEVGNIVKCFVGEVFDGYVELLEFEDEKSFLKHEHSAVYIKSRWRVRFCTPEEVEDKKMERSDVWNQRSKANIRTHRNFVYRADINYTAYFNKYGGEPEDKPVVNKDAIFIIDKPTEIF